MGNFSAYLFQGEGFNATLIPEFFAFSIIKAVFEISFYSTTKSPFSKKERQLLISSGVTRPFPPANKTMEFYPCLST
jgi:hypothetical protein